MFRTESTGHTPELGERVNARCIFFVAAQLPQRSFLLLLFLLFKALIYSLACRFDDQH